MIAGTTQLVFFLDLSQAFDTVDHSILLDKLHCYGIRGVAYNWIPSYFSNRFQYVSVNNITSNHLPICCGVPQGSILGPLLFVIYINDLSMISCVIELILFADDTNLFLHGISLSSLELRLNRELENLSTWFKVNMLSLNPKKTNYMIFTQKTNVTDTLMNIKTDNVPIQKVHQTRFLGVIINDKLL